ncbi:MAG: type VI secretion system tip protein TssI/VgrG [Polyangiaceae bacterium]
MATTSLWFESGEGSLSVCEYSVVEGLSALFEITLVARSPDEALDLHAMLGRTAVFRIGPHLAPSSAAEASLSSPRPAPALAATSRTFAGICSAARQLRVEPTGLSTYELRIVPHLWLLTQRTHHRVFQHRSVPEIAAELLAEWGIEARWNVARDLPAPRICRPLRRDRSFFSDGLGEAGIAPRAATLGRSALPARAPPLRSSPSSSALASAGSRRRPALHDSPAGSMGIPHVTEVKISHELRPARVALQGFDFRRSLAAPLSAAATDSASSSAPHTGPALEQHVYSPVDFFAEKSASEGKGPRTDTPVADDRGVSRAEESTGKRMAERRLATARAGAREVEFVTNALDLAPGAVFTIDGHAHIELAPGRKLLITHLETRGDDAGQGTIRARAVFADTPYLPPKVAPKPVVHGVESAVVVGPPGEEIHTDELGRVRVRFHWSRDLRHDETSSCWIRVSQSWAGSGYGMFALPRVGHEVIVGFFGGDPDQPVIVGRLHNSTSVVPDRLPESRTATTWRSASSPGGQGWNEITFEDQAGHERVYMQAERDLVKLVKSDETSTVRGHRARRVEASETVAIAGAQVVTVGAARSTHVAGSDHLSVGEGHSVTVQSSGGAPGATGFEVTDRKITLSTGEATLTLEGPNMTLEAAANILLQAASSITIQGRADIHIAGGAHVLLKSKSGDLVIEGGPDVFINPREGVELDPGEIPMETPLDLDMGEEIQDAEDLAVFNPEDPESLKAHLAPGGLLDPARFGPEHEDLGYFMAGVSAAAAGIPLGVMMRQMGKRRLAEHGPESDCGDPGNGLFGGQAPYGNDPHHVDLMKRGARYHAHHHGPEPR